MHLIEHSRTRSSHSCSFISATLLLLGAPAGTACSPGAVAADGGAIDGAAAATTRVPDTAPEPLIGLGEFNGARETFPRLDPCAEVSRQVYQEVGFMGTIGDLFVEPDFSSSCSFEAPEEDHGQPR